MLNRIVQLSLRYRGIVIALAVLGLVYGFYVALHAKLDVFPEFAPPQVVIQTEAPGLSPEEVEALVTRPLESSLNGAPDLVAIRSQSIQGLSVITVVFADHADIFRVRQMVSERLTQVAGELPQGAHAPKMGPLTSSTSLTLAIGLTAPEQTPMALRTFADWTMRPRLLGVPGVSKVDVFGGQVRQLQIQVQPDRLLACGLALDEVLAAARQSTGLRGAGFIENPNQRIVIRTEGQSLSPDALGEAVLAYHDGRRIRLKDVARVVDGPEPKFGDAQIMGTPGVVMLIHSQFGANTLEVTAALEQALAELQPALKAEQIQLHRRLFRPASFIQTALGNVQRSLLIGGLLVLVVLFFFLLDWRTAFISFASIPLSLLAAVSVLDEYGVAINTITLGGFAIAIGVVVDDAIIDVENILRRVRENRALSAPRGLFQVVLEASLEVRSAVVYATFIVALVFLPVLTMTGVQGKLFAPLGVAFILAILASLAVALTLTPALCYTMLSRLPPHAEPGYVRWLKDRQRRGLAALSRHVAVVITLVLLLFAGALATLPFFGGEFLPEFREGHFILHMGMVPGTSLEESLRLGRRVTGALLQHPKIRSVSQEAGRAEVGEDPWGTHLSEFHVDLHTLKGEEAERIVVEIRDILEKFPGATFRILPFLAERIEETISGTTAEVVVNIFGPDLRVLDEKAGEVRAVLARIRGATDVQMEAPPASPEMIVRLRPRPLTQFGFPPGAVLAAIQTACQGTPVAQVYDGNRVFNVTVILDEASRRVPEQLSSLMLRNAQGVRLPLRELADIYAGTGRYAVVHEGAQRRQQVTCNVQGRDLDSFMAELRRQVTQKVRFPSGYYPQFTGSGAEQAHARQQLLLHAAVAGAGIVLLLGMVFRNGRNLLLVLANVPFALVGGVLAVFAFGGLLSIGSLVGFVTLFGVTMRNSIMMISHFEHLVSKEGLAWNLETMLRGASERLLPVLMTALVTGLALLPLALSTGEAGHEIEGPMAIVILGGLLTSTLLTLLVLPALALRFGRFSTTTGPE